MTDIRSTWIIDAHGNVLEPGQVARKRTGPKPRPELGDARAEILRRIEQRRARRDR